MTHAERHSRDRYAYYIRLLNEDEELSLEWWDDEQEAAEQLDEIESNHSTRWLWWEMVKVDCYNRCDTVIDSGEF